MMAQRIQTFLAGLLMGLISTGLLLLVISEPRGNPVKLLPPPTPHPLRIHVAGAVQNPGVYLLPPNAITGDAIEAAGGALENARISFINLAAPLEDGQQVYLPPAEESAAIQNPPLIKTTASEPTNINTASAAELELLPGIGPSLAQKIIEYRHANGPFTKLEGLLQVSGIGPAKLETLLPLICLR